MRGRLVLWLGMLVAAVLVVASPARAENVLKLGTLAPESSPWGQVLSVWQRAVRERTGGGLTIRFYWNATQGDEVAMVGKIKAGQLDGAAVSALGLAKVYPPILALQMPGLFRGWGELDAARDALREEFQKAALERSGIRIAGWGDVGRVRMFSKGFAVGSPTSLRGQRPWVGRENDLTRMVYQVLGGVTPVPLSVPEVLPALTSGSVNAMAAPALVCEQLQWAARLDHVLDDSSSMLIGAMLLSEASLSRLPADQSTVLRQTGDVATRELTRRIRGEDEAAYQRLRKKMQVHQLTDAERREWQELFRGMRQRVAQQRTFPPELVTRLEKMRR